MPQLNLNLEELQAVVRSGPPRRAVFLRIVGGPMASIIAPEDPNGQAREDFTSLELVADIVKTVNPEDYTPFGGRLSEKDTSGMWDKPMVPALSYWTVDFGNNIGLLGVRTGRGMIVVDYVCFARDKKWYAHPTPVFLALYHRTEGSIDTLRHIFFNDVWGLKERYALRTFESDAVHTWVRHSPGWDALSHTQTFNIVNNIIDGAFPPATRRISQIVAIQHPYRKSWDFRFDIEAF
ncbi:hypothetical protein N7456_002530 [Penicillium angulare]|uniref:Uncharacterized protein n=1 Tax=Penicillium angulare TaxID=116970 RepID=A0A9W9G8D8_9EURO|nr:hypothetical protein N7456_002530 [Penicillium angulare]